VARTTRIKYDSTGLKWIVNRAHLCAADPARLAAPARCSPFDPWRGNYTECRWGSDEYKVPWEATGVDDTKLFRWPGRGLWSITGRRPPRPAGGKAWCRQPVVWRQFVVQLAREGEDVDVARWDVAPRETPPGVEWAAESPAPSRAEPAAVAAAAAAGVEAEAEETAAAPKPKPQPQPRLAALRKLLLDVFAAAGGPPAEAPSRSLAQEADDGAGQPRQGQRRRRRRPGAGGQGQQPGGGGGGSGGQFGGQRMRRRMRRRHARGPGAEAGGAAAGAGAAAGGRRSRSPQPGGGGGGGGGGGQRLGWRSRWGAPPLGLAISDAKQAYGTRHSIYEKNWMPFVSNDRLFAVQSLAPRQKVYRLRADGLAVLLPPTDSTAVFGPLKVKLEELHGGPPLVLVDWEGLEKKVEDPKLAGVVKVGEKEGRGVVESSSIMRAAAGGS
jgi:hypothetical protein